MSTCRPTLSVNTDAPPSAAVTSPSCTFVFSAVPSLADSPPASPLEPSTPPPLSCDFPPPDSPSLQSPASPSAQRRRKLSVGFEIDERRPRKGDEDYIKRPENAFMLFRRKCAEDRAAEAAESGRKKRQADLSKSISQQWKSLTPDERQYWENLAKEKKKEHEKRYPDYVYRPMRIRDKDGKVRNKKRVKKNEHGDSFTFVLPDVVRSSGRSASAPNHRPPCYQAVQIPRVYSSGSCPPSPTASSPSLMSLIRSAHPAHSEAASEFDFYPQFDQSGFQAELQSSDFVQSMFNAPEGEPIPSMDQQSVPLLLPAHEITSPSSCMSSPETGPFTPPIQTLDQSFSPLNMQSEQSQCSSDFANCEWDPMGTTAAGLSYDYSWSSATSLWPSADDGYFAANDFDVSSIPPIELCLPKQSDFISPDAAPPQYDYYPQQPERYLDDNLVGLSDLIVEHTF